MTPSLHPSLQRAALGLVTLALSAGAASAQTTWYVDDDAPGDPGPGNPFVSDPNEDGSAQHPFDRIQEAVNAAAGGDEVRVLAGTYFDLATIDVSAGQGAGRALWIRGVEGPDATTIDGSALFDQVLQAVSGEGPDTVLEGLTITGGDPGFAVGDHGGGMEVRNSSPTFRRCVFSGNQARLGGGVYLTASDSLFERCRFEGNYADYQGAGLYVDRGHVVLEHCTLQQNSARIGGGGLISRGVSGSSLAVRDCTFYANTCTEGGGAGLSKWDATLLTVERTRFVSNTAAGGGGGAFVNGGGILRSCLFDSNSSASSEGGGLTMWTGNSTQVHGSTFVENTGHGVWTHAAGTGSVTSSILWNNSPQEAVGNVGITYSDVLGGFAGVGNIDAYPMFADEDGADGVRGNLDDDLRLFSGSPCVDAGDTVPWASASEPYPLDLAGRPRAADEPGVQNTGRTVLGLTVDMGAYELQTGRLGRVE